MLTLTAQTVSLVNDDFNDLSIRNDISYGQHKVSVYANDEVLVHRHVACFLK